MEIFDEKEKNQISKFVLSQVLEYISKFKKLFHSIQFKSEGKQVNSLTTTIEVEEAKVSVGSFGTTCSSFTLAAN